MIKNLPTSAGDVGSILGSGRSPGEGNGNSLQSYCLENPVDRSVRWATVHGIAKSRTRLKRLSGGGGGGGSSSSSRSSASISKGLRTVR